MKLSQAEKDTSYGFTHMWNIKNSTEDHRGREGNLKGEKSERKMNHERLWTPRNNLGVSEGRRVRGGG